MGFVLSQQVPWASLLPSLRLRLLCASYCGKGDLRLCGWCRHSWPVIRRYPGGSPPAPDIPLEPQLPGSSSLCSPTVDRGCILYSPLPPAQRACCQPRSCPSLLLPPLSSLPHTGLLNLEPTGQHPQEPKEKGKSRQAYLSLSLFPVSSLTVNEKTCSMTTPAPFPTYHLKCNRPCFHILLTLC